MATKSILVYLNDGEETQVRLEFAVDACKQLDAQLIALYVHEVHIPVGAIGRGGYVAEDPEKIQKRADDLREEVAKRCKSQKIEWEWAQSDDEHLETILKLAALADLTISPQVNVEELEDHLIYKFVERMIMEIGGPILIIPKGYKAKGISSGLKILIAWRPVGEAIRAVRDSLELLKAAKAVTVFTADSDPDHRDNPPDGILKYLKLHGIAAESDHHIQDKRIGDQILNVADVHDSDLIVMGAYGKMGIAERLFGGATRHVVTTSKIPLLISH